MLTYIQELPECAARIILSYHIMSGPGIKLMAAGLNLLERPFKDVLPTELHSRSLEKISSL